MNNKCGHDDCFSYSFPDCILPDVDCVETTRKYPHGYIKKYAQKNNVDERKLYKEYRKTGDLDIAIENLKSKKPCGRFFIENKWLSAKEVSKKYGISINTIYYWGDRAEMKIKERLGIE